MSGSVPLEFVVPPGWAPVPADEMGAPEGTVVLLDEATRGPGFTANITVGGEEEPAGRRLADVADDVLDDLATRATEVEPLGRDVFDDSLVQQVRFTAVVNGAGRRLVQSQVFVALPAAVLRIVLTATEDRFPALVPDFQGFVSTVQPRG